jgi:hypothetical protein
LVGWIKERWRWKDESDVMLRMLTVACDATNPSSGSRTYAGYTNEELSGGRPHVLVRR